MVIVVCSVLVSLLLQQCVLLLLQIRTGLAPRNISSLSAMCCVPSLSERMYCTSFVLLLSTCWVVPDGLAVVAEAR